MNPKANIFSHPEIELREALPRVCTGKAFGPETSLDLLEVYPQKIAWKQGLDHARLLSYFKEEDDERLSDPAKPHPLRVFFLEDLSFGSESPTSDPAAQSTSCWLRRRFSITPLFSDCLKSSKCSVTIGNGSFIRREKGKRISLDGLYRYSAGLTAPPQHPLPPVHVWFSQSLTSDRGSTYMIHHCPEDAKRHIVSCANGPNFESLLRPFVIDLFLAEDCITQWVHRVSQTRNDLLKYESPLPDDLDHDLTAKSVEKLYQVSQLFQIIRDILTDVGDQFDYLVTVLGRHHDCQTASHFLPASCDEIDDTSIIESLEFLRSKNQILRRWVVNYTERTQVQINRFFNHATHKDGAINLNISQLTSKIAVSSQRDGSAMITMAAVTMFFLPGTFVSTFFSMTFFNAQTNDAGKTSFSVAPQWWIFPVVTVPLTVFVFVIWSFWRQTRDKKKLGELISVKAVGMNNDDMEKQYHGQMSSFGSFGSNKRHTL